MSERISGLRVFLLATLYVMSKGENVSCKDIEDNLAHGIATKLFYKFQRLYEECGLSESSLQPVDDYYRNWDGCADGCEEEYCCTKENGLQLIVALALNEFK